MNHPTITPELVHEIRHRFSLDWRGVHGPRHWARVRANGLRLAASTGARSHVVELFAFLHDACRENEFEDAGHGPRAAEFAKQLNGRMFSLRSQDLALLVTACSGHSNGTLKADVTVQTCWDADRLDLGRVGIKPHPGRLCTQAAREPRMIEWAHERSLREFRFWRRSMRRT